MDVTPFGFPHSDIPGSLITSISPRLFAGSHVLLLLLVPRHPPHALCNFSFCFLFESLMCSVIFVNYRIF